MLPGTQGYYIVITLKYTFLSYLFGFLFQGFQLIDV